MKSRPRKFTIAYYYCLTRMQSCGGHCIIIILYFSMLCNTHPYSRQLPKHYEPPNSRLVRGVAQANWKTPSFQAIPVFESPSPQSLNDTLQTLHQPSGTKMCPYSVNGGAKVDVWGLQLATPLALRRSLPPSRPSPSIPSETRHSGQYHNLGRFFSVLRPRHSRWNHS